MLCNITCNCARQTVHLTARETTPKDPANRWRWNVEFSHRPWPSNLENRVFYKKEFCILKLKVRLWDDAYVHLFLFCLLVVYSLEETSLSTWLRMTMYLQYEWWLCHNMMKVSIFSILFAGCGFIGRNLVEYLIENDYVSAVRVVDKVPPQTAWLNEKHQELFNNPKVHFKSANLINPGKWHSRKYIFFKLLFFFFCWVYFLYWYLFLGSYVRVVPRQFSQEQFYLHMKFYILHFMFLYIREHLYWYDIS